MNIAQILSTLFKLKSSVDYISKQGVLPYSPILSYNKSAVVTYQDSLYLAFKKVPIGNVPSNSPTYWLNLTERDNGVVNVSTSDSELVFTFSNGNTQAITLNQPQTLVQPSNGVDGVDGIDGTDGVGITNVSQNGDTVVITLTDGNSYQFTLPKASPLQPHSITNITYENNSFVITLSDQSSYSVDVELPKGDAATIQIGEIATVEYDKPASIENVGDDNNAILNISIPKGKDAISVESIEQLSLETIEVRLTDGTTYQFVLPKGEDGNDADEVTIINTVFEKLSLELSQFIQQQDIVTGLLKEELQSLVDYNIDDVEGKLSDSLERALLNLPKVTIEDIRDLVSLSLNEYKLQQENERQEGIAELRAFISNY